MNQIPMMIGVILLLYNCAGNTETAEFMAGAAQKNITPMPGSYIAGDANNRQFTGVHDSLYVRAVVFSDEANNLSMLSFDCIGLLYPELLKIRSEVSKRLTDSDFQPGNIVMASTHTHSGPDVVGIWGPDQLTSGIDSSYMNHLVNQAASAIIEAWSTRAPAKALYGISDFGEDWVYNISDSLSLDRSLTALQFENSDGKSIATVTAFACHPTIMDAASTKVSADYLSGFYKHLDHQLGGVTLFLQGAIGGWVQPEYEKKKFEVALKRGEELGKSVESLLKHGTPFDNTQLRFQSMGIQLPVSNPGFKYLAAAGVIDRQISDSVQTEIAWFRVGDACFATHPGETTPVHSLETKALMKTNGPKIVIGFGMDAVGYILSPEFFQKEKGLKHLGYLMSMSIDREAGPVLMKKMEELASQEHTLND